MSLWSVTWAQFWSSLFFQTNMERGYWCRDMFRDFTVQPATGWSPAGKAYTHQFPEHVFFYIGIFFFFHRMCPMSPSWSLGVAFDQTQIISWWNVITITSLMQLAEYTTVKLCRHQQCGLWEETVFTAAVTQNTKKVHTYTIYHKFRNCTTAIKGTGLWIAALSTANLLISSLFNKQTFLFRKSQTSQSSSVRLLVTTRKKESNGRKRKRVLFYLGN